MNVRAISAGSNRGILLGVVVAPGGTICDGALTRNE